MAATQFTENFGLCAWKETDKPKRIDFVNDNTIIDTKMAEHFSDKTMHLTSDEKEAILSPYSMFTYAGDGTARREIPLNMSYSIAIVYQKYYPATTIDESNNAVSRFGVTGRIFGTSGGLTLTSNSLIVMQDEIATDGVINNFNENEGQYVVLLFR